MNSLPEMDGVLLCFLFCEYKAVYAINAHSRLVVERILCWIYVQGLLFLLCALCPQDVSKVRVGKLSPYGIESLGHIRDFLGVKFFIKPEPSTGTVMLTCFGCGLKNLSRKLSWKMFIGLYHVLFVTCLLLSGQGVLSCGLMLIACNLSG